MTSTKNYYKLPVVKGVLFMKDGIYFNMPEDEYHSIDRLSASGMKDILESPTKYWFNSKLNPLYCERATDAMDAGTMYHTYILEGESVFNDKYIVMPSEIEALNKNSSAFKLWKAGQSKKIIPWQKYFEMKKNIRYLEQDGQILSTNFLKDGYPEVSILWTDDKGIDRKARLDFLRESSFVDLKTFATDKVGDVESYIAKYFFNYKVFLQLINYRQALLAGRDLNVNGTKEQKKFFQIVKESEDYVPFVIFVNRNLPQARIKAFTKENCEDLWRLGEKMIENAQYKYLSNIDKYGKKSAWLEDVDLQSLKFTDLDFPQSFYEILKGGE